MGNIAHAAALEAGGTTIAVLPCGLPNTYPASHRALAMDIVNHSGALVTEYDSNHEFSYQSNFLERNRIVSELTDAIVITEAAIRSGTLSTAARAGAGQGPCLVVPGNITSPMSVGCNALLKQGATILTDAADVIHTVAPQLSAEKSPHTPLGRTPAEAAIIAQLQAGINDGETIQKNTKLSATELNTAFTMLEIAGTICALGGNRWTLLT